EFQKSPNGLLELIGANDCKTPMTATMELTAVSESSMMVSAEASALTNAAALSIYKDPSIAQSTSTKAIENESNHSNDNLKSPLSNSLVNTQKENQVPFSRFAEKKDPEVHSESQNEFIEQPIGA